jgi:hypothetical protein
VRVEGFDPSAGVVGRWSDGWVKKRLTAVNFQKNDPR